MARDGAGEPDVRRDAPVWRAPDVVGLDTADHAAVVEALMLKTSTLEWFSGARWGETVEVYVDALSLGRSSLVLRFTLTADGRRCCVVETTYVWTAEGRSAPWPEHLRTAVGAHLVEQHHD